MEIKAPTDDCCKHLRCANRGASGAPMPWEMTLKTIGLAAFLLMAGASTALAAPACDSEIEKTKSDWQAIHLEPAAKPAAISKGVGTHAHVQSAVDSMRFRLAEAEALCKQGQDHGALLHLDIVRAFLNLPEIQHPTDHQYLLNPATK